MRNLLLFIVVIGTLSFTLSNKVTKSTEKASIATGKISPQFSYKDNNGKLVNLEDLKGNYIYIDIWATWCKPCKEEMPILEKIKDVYTENIKFVSISVDYRKDIDKWKKQIADNNPKGIHLMTDKNWHSDFIRAYNVNTIPRFILIDPQGKIVDAHAPRPSQQKKIHKVFKKLNIH